MHWLSYFGYYPIALSSAASKNSHSSFVVMGRSSVSLSGIAFGVSAFVLYAEANTVREPFIADAVVGVYQIIFGTAAAFHEQKRFAFCDPAHLP